MYKERIKQIRSELNLSVAKMAKAMDVSARTFVSYESDGRTPSLEFLAQMCKTYGVNANWFITGQGKMFVPPQYEDVKTDILKEVEQMLKDRGL